jgi:hypothetical protein
MNMDTVSLAIARSRHGQRAGRVKNKGPEIKTKRGATESHANRR